MHTTFLCNSADALWLLPAGCTTSYSPLAFSWQATSVALVLLCQFGSFRGCLVDKLIIFTVHKPAGYHLSLFLCVFLGHGRGSRLRRSPARRSSARTDLVLFCGLQFACGVSWPALFAATYKLSVGLSLAGVASYAAITACGLSCSWTRATAGGHLRPHPRRFGICSAPDSVGLALLSLALFIGGFTTRGHSRHFIAHHSWAGTTLLPSRLCLSVHSPATTSPPWNTGSGGSLLRRTRHRLHHSRTYLAFTSDVPAAALGSPHLPLFVAVAHQAHPHNISTN